MLESRRFLSTLLEFAHNVVLHKFPNSFSCSIVEWMNDDDNDDWMTFYLVETDSDWFLYFRCNLQLEKSTYRVFRIPIALTVTWRTRSRKRKRLQNVNQNSPLEFAETERGYSMWHFTQIGSIDVLLSSVIRWTERVRIVLCVCVFVLRVNRN